MSAPKMYYAVVKRKTGKPFSATTIGPVFYTAKSKIPDQINRVHDIIPIPAHEIDNLIKKYRK